MSAAGESCHCRGIPARAGAGHRRLAGTRLAGSGPGNQARWGALCQSPGQPVSGLCGCAPRPTPGSRKSASAPASWRWLRWPPSSAPPQRSRSWQRSAGHRRRTGRWPARRGPPCRPCGCGPRCPHASRAGVRLRRGTPARPAGLVAPVIWPPARRATLPPARRARTSPAATASGSSVTTAISPGAAGGITTSPGTTGGATAGTHATAGIPITTGDRGDGEAIRPHRSMTEPLLGRLRDREGRRPLEPARLFDPAGLHRLEAGGSDQPLDFVAGTVVVGRVEEDRRLR